MDIKNVWEITLLRSKPLRSALFRLISAIVEAIPAKVGWTTPTHARHHRSIRPDWRRYRKPTRRNDDRLPSSPSTGCTFSHYNLRTRWFRRSRCNTPSRIPHTAPSNRSWCRSARCTRSMCSSGGRIADRRGNRRPTGSPPRPCRPRPPRGTLRTIRPACHSPGIRCTSRWNRRSSWTGWFRRPRRTRMVLGTCSSCSC